MSSLFRLGLLAVLPSVALSGCVSDVIAPADDGGDRDVYTMVADVGNAQGFVLTSNTVVDVLREPERTHLQGADFLLTVTMVVLLHGVGSDPFIFCDVGDGYASVDDVPTAAGECAWSDATLGVNAPGGCSVEPGQAFLVRAPDGALKRLRIASCDVDDVNVATVSFELR